MEEFDVLDEKGNYTRKIATREECHKQGLWHKAVAIFVINSQNQVLLQRRSPNKKLWPNMWDITAGGHVLAGEFGFEAVIRELKEELGSDVRREDMILIGAVISSQQKGDIINNHFNEFYIIQKDIDINTLTLQEEEVAEVKWLDKDEIMAEIRGDRKNITDKEGCWEYLEKYYEWSER